MYTQSDSEIEENILIAKESIKDACGKEPLGFRAPAFSIYPKAQIHMKYYLNILFMILAMF